MITLITGAPGAGKSAALVSLLAELVKGRALYVDGIPDLKVEHQPLEVKKWPSDVPDGSAIAIDEVQRVWRPRGPGQKVPDDVALLETHRHRGLDFFIGTQHPKLLDTNVRSLVGRHIHIRDLGILGRWWYEWPEAADPSSWKNAPIKKRYKLNKKSFALYKSASEHVKPIRSFPMALVVAVVALVATLALAYFSYRTINARLKPVNAPVAAAAPAVSGVTPAAAAASAPAAQPVASGKPVYLDDITAFTPRYSAQPESAPAFDDLRRVLSMPQVAGGACSPSKGCKCFTHQGSDAGLSHDECSLWVKSPPFDPYRAPPPVQSAQAAPHPVQPASAPEPHPVIVSEVGGYGLRDQKTLQARNESVISVLATDTPKQVVHQ